MLVVTQIEAQEFSENLDFLLVREGEFEFSLSGKFSNAIVKFQRITADDGVTTLYQACDGYHYGSVYLEEGLYRLAVVADHYPDLHFSLTPRGPSQAALENPFMVAALPPGHEGGPVTWDHVTRQWRPKAKAEAKAAEAAKA